MGLIVLAIAGIGAYLYFNQKSSAATLSETVETGKGAPSVKPKGEGSASTGLGGAIGGIIGGTGVGGPVGGAIAALSNVFHVKTSYKIKTDVSVDPYKTLYNKIRQLKNETGVFNFSDWGAAQCVRYYYGDFPQPDRDSSDTKNRLVMAHYWGSVVRLSALPVNAGIDWSGY